MSSNIEKLTTEILAGHQITYEQVQTLLLSSTDQLLKYSKFLKDHFTDSSFNFCTIINGKSGLCSEDCAYCAQSVHHSGHSQVYDLLDYDTILESAKHHQSRGIPKFSIVTSGRSPSTEDLSKLKLIYKGLSQDTKIDLCASHGLMTHESLNQLKDSGVTRYHNNLETSRNYFSKICSTHTYDEKIDTIKAAQKVGLEICSGGLIGIGETMIDRIDLAFQLRQLGITSIPLNLLSPIPGTPLASISPISEDDFIRTCAVFRFIHPRASLRLAGGRGLLADKGRLLFSTCINGAITGELLTTSGNDTSNDWKMIKELNYEINN